MPEKLFDIGRKRNMGRYREGEPSDLPDSGNDFSLRTPVSPQSPKDIAEKKTASSWSRPFYRTQFKKLA